MGAVGQPCPHIWGNKTFTHHFHFPSSLWEKSQHSTSSTGVITSVAVKSATSCSSALGSKIAYWVSPFSIHPTLSLSCTNCMLNSPLSQAGLLQILCCLWACVQLPLSRFYLHHIELEWGSAMTLLDPQPLPSSFLSIFGCSGRLETFHVPCCNVQRQFCSVKQYLISCIKNWEKMKTTYATTMLLS